MPYRTFADEQGKSWEIWEVRPERVERRGQDRRRDNPTAWPGTERRRASDRRQRPDSRLASSHPLAHGWLVFKSEDEKRRLAPIPPDWDSCHGHELHDLWAKARVIAARGDVKTG
ncbi:MAG: hypothetical protein ACR2GJ_06780 [Gemmatimonadaceae bacterium]